MHALFTSLIAGFITLVVGVAISLGLNHSRDLRDVNWAAAATVATIVAASCYLFRKR